MPNTSQARASLEDLAALNAELAALVRARIPLEPELRRLGRQLLGGAGAMAERLAARMNSGASLTEAMDAEQPAVPEAYRAVVAAGMASGQPAVALENVAASARRLASLRETTWIGLLHPVAVVVLASILWGCVATLAMRRMQWIEPRTLAPYEELISQAWVPVVFGLVIPLVVLAMAAVWWWTSRYPRDGGSRPWQLGWIPGNGSLRRTTAAATVAEMLRISSGAGLPLPEALELAANATSYGPYRRSLEGLAAHCAAGGSPSEGADRWLLQLPSLVQLGLRQSGARQLMQATFARASRAYQSRAENLEASLTETVPALLTIGLAGTATAAYTISLVWPYAMMLKTIAGGLWR